MRAFELRDGFGLEHLVPGTRPVPEPGPGEVRIRVRAVSLNYRDLLTVKGLYNPKQPLPLIPCSDGVGEVEEVGPGVTRVRAGDRVVPVFNQAWQAGEFTREMRTATLGGPRDGTLCESMVVPAEGVVVPPRYLNDAEAATLPCTAVTAWSALVAQGGIRPGDTVLVQGTGGVSMFALQIAKAAGCRVIQTSSSDRKLAQAADLGADHGINYRDDPDWDRTVRDLTQGRGVDLVVEVGGGGTMERSLAAVRVGGTVAVIGVLAGRSTELDLAPLLMRRVRMQGVIVGSRADFEDMNRAFEAHRIHPVVDRVFPFEEAVDAFRHMEAGRHLGKVVVAVP